MGLPWRRGGPPRESPPVVTHQRPATWWAGVAPSSTRRWAWGTLGRGARCGNAARSLQASRSPTPGSRAVRPRLQGPTPFPACLWLPPAHGCAPAGHRTQCGRLRPSRGRRRPRGREKPCGRAGAGPVRRRPRRRQGGRAPLGCTHVGPLWGRPTAEPLRSGAGHRRSARRQTSTRRYCHVLAQHTLQPAFPTPTPTPASGPRAPGLPPAARLGSSPPRMAAGCRLRGAPGLGLLLCATAQGPDRGAPRAACGEPLQGHGECRGRQPPTPVEDGCPGAGVGEQPPRGWTWTLVASLSGTCSPDRQPTVRGGRMEPCGLSTLPQGWVASPPIPERPGRHLQHTVKAEPA